jgi:hypothetical protein
VDPTLRRVSLKRVAARAKKNPKAPGRKASASSKRVARSKRRAHAKAPLRPQHDAPSTHIPIAGHTPIPEHIQIAEHVRQPETPAQVEADSVPSPGVRPQAPLRSSPAARTELIARPSRGARPAPASGRLRPWLIAGALALVGTAVLIAAHRPARQDDFASAVDAVYKRPAPDLVLSPARNTVVAPPFLNPVPVGTTGSKPGIMPSPSAKKVEPAPLPPAATLVAAPASAPEPEKTLSRPEPEAPVLEASAEPPITISGCLERGDETFVLKNTSGADAPKSRNWKTGFLKKRPATIELLDAGGALKLQRYVGQRVTATGTLTNHEMHPRSVTTSGSCS